MIDIDQVHSATQDLRPLPASVARLTTILSQRDVDLREVAEIVSLDMMLTAQILKTANSALYRGKQSITVVKDAVTQLGTGIVLAVVMSQSVRRELDQAIPAYDLGEGQLWKRSVACALAAESMRTVLPLADIPQTAFTAALLHEIGRTILGRFLTKELLAELRSKRDELGDEALAESQVLGIHHAEVGALIAQRWKLPRPIVHAIAYHTMPDRGCDKINGFDAEAATGRFDAICDTVHIASAAAREFTGDTSNPLSRVAIGARDRLRCDDHALLRMMERSKARLCDVLDLYGAGAGPSTATGSHGGARQPSPVGKGAR